MRCLWLVWTLLTSLATFLCAAGCLLPYWLKGYVNVISGGQEHSGSDNGIITNHRLLSKTELPTELGLFRRCGYPIYFNHSALPHSHRSLTEGTKITTSVYWQQGCGHYSLINQSPHTAWYVAFLALILACAILFFDTSFLILIGFAIHLFAIPKVYRSCQLMLILSGVSTAVTCLLYPIGWSQNNEVTQACGEEAKAFQPGRCQIGWAYVLTCSGGLVSIFAALLPIIFPKPNKATSCGKPKSPSTGKCCWTSGGSISSHSDEQALTHIHSNSPTNSHKSNRWLVSNKTIHFNSSNSCVPIDMDNLQPSASSIVSKSSSVTNLHHTVRPYHPHRHSVGALLGTVVGNGGFLMNSGIQQKSMGVEPLIYVAEEEEEQLDDKEVSDTLTERCETNHSQRINHSGYSRAEATPCFSSFSLTNLNGTPVPQTCQPLQFIPHYPTSNSSRIMPTVFRNRHGSKSTQQQQHGTMTDPVKL